MRNEFLTTEDTEVHRGTRKTKETALILSVPLCYLRVLCVENRLFIAIPFEIDGLKSNTQPDRLRYPLEWFLPSFRADFFVA